MNRAQWTSQKATGRTKELMGSAPDLSFRPFPGGSNLRGGFKKERGQPCPRGFPPKPPAHADKAVRAPFTRFLNRPCLERIRFGECFRTRIASNNVVVEVTMIFRPCTTMTRLGRIFHAPARSVGRPTELEPVTKVRLFRSADAYIREFV